MKINAMKRSLFLLLVLFVGSLLVMGQERTTLTVTGTVSTTISLTNKEVIIPGKSDLHITAAYTPLSNSIIRLNSENAWLFFDNIRPQTVIDSLLPYIYVNGDVATYRGTARVAIYRHGAVVIPQSTAFQPLTFFSGQNCTGDSLKFSLFTVNNSFGAFDNKCRSFRLKRGYMATVYNNSDGTGYSRVFIASDGDLVVNTLSSYLDKTISMVRVMPWEWVSKKGWCQTGWGSSGDVITNSNKMNATWFYTWSADNSSRPNFEYVPIRSQQYWPSWSQINGQNYVSHVMSFNEPDHTEQSNVSVAQAIAQWPDFQKTGLRIGSPACTDFSAWLYPFMDSIKAHNYRLDYVVIHAYWGGYAATQWYNALKAIHDKTGRPLWIKEWNNGANWTTESWPSSYSDGLAKQLNELKAILNVMDTAHFVERYSIYNWVGPMRMMISDDGWVTPAGEYYRDRKPPLAFSRVNEVVPSYKFSSKSTSMDLVANSSDSKITLSWTNGDQEFASEIVVEKKPDGGTYSELFRTSQTAAISSYVDTHDFTQTGKFTYRVRILLNNGTEQISNEESFFVTGGTDIQYGKFSTSSVDWNTVAFKNNYSTVPAVFTGAPTNVSSSALLTTKVKVSSSRLMSFQLAPWTYQKLAALSAEESVPYFVIKPGNYNFGGLKAIVSKTTVSGTWKTVTFSSAFDSVPVVFVSTTTSNNTIPTNLRVRNVTKTGFDVKLQKESKNSVSLVSEVFSYMAVSQGVGSVNGNKLIVGKTTENAVGNAVTQYARVVYPETIANPIFLSQMQTCNDDTVTATLRCRSVLTTEARVFKQRELSMGYSASATETAGYLLINPDVVQAVDAVQSSVLRIYSNPVKDKLYIEWSLADAVKVDVYDMSGILVRSILPTENYIDVSSLKAGYYMLKTGTNQIMKFIKD